MTDLRALSSEEIIADAADRLASALLALPPDRRLDVTKRTITVLALRIGAAEVDPPLVVHG